ncbi:MAG TPA: flagellar basal body protein [Nocardioides sp.]
MDRLPLRTSEAVVSLLSPLGSGDLVTASLHTALDGLATRQGVIADNIANVDTPGFRASSVQFEDNLLAAIRDGRAGGPVPVTVTATDTPVGANDNNVDLRKETLAAMQTQFQFQMAGRAATDHFELIRTTAAAS